MLKSLWTFAQDGGQDRCRAKKCTWPLATPCAWSPRDPQPQPPCSTSIEKNSGTENQGKVPLQSLRARGPGQTCEFVHTVVATPVTITQSQRRHIGRPNEHMFELLTFSTYQPPVPLPTPAYLQAVPLNFTLEPTPRGENPANQNPLWLADTCHVTIWSDIISLRLKSHQPPN